MPSRIKVRGAAVKYFGAVYGRNKEKVAQSLITEDVRRGIRQLRELEDRFLNGSVDPRAMRGRLQDLIEGNFRYERTPWWYLEPESQITAVKALLPRLNQPTWTIPPIPAFTQRTETEILMLCIYLPDLPTLPGTGFTHTIEVLGKKIPFAHPCVKLRRPEVSERITQRIRSYEPGIRWVAVDLEANQDVSVSDYVYGQRKTNLADVEVVMAAYLFTDWVYLWEGINESRRESVPRPALGNLRYDFYDEDFGVPVFDVEEHHDKEDVLKLEIWVDHVHKPTVCLPTVRELT